MKFRRMREVYWLEAKASATKVIENVIPMRDIMEPARVANSWRAPSSHPKEAWPQGQPTIAPHGVRLD